VNVVPGEVKVPIIDVDMEFKGVSEEEDDKSITKVCDKG
jgi:hypothetical protein